MDRAEVSAWLRLALSPGIGDVGARKLLASFGLPEAIFAQDPQALAQVVGERAAAGLAKAPDALQAQVDATLAWLEGGPERRIVTLADTRYPAGLLQTADPPLMLYAMGPARFELGPAIAIVGSRNPTPQGRENAARFGRALSEAGMTVVSGLALGVDGAAHEGALDGARPGHFATVAVVGTGLDRVYPSRHRALAHRIAEHGWLVSEYPIGTPPLPQNFPKRNRIISALSQGTLVVEAALQSGSLITARFAAEQGREVFAVPGSIHSPQARGCHQLLREGAKLVESAQDVLEELRGMRPAVRETAAAAVGADDDVGEGFACEDASAGRTKDERSLLAAMGFDPVTLDALVARTGVGIAHLQARLLELELAGDVARLPGGLFQRVGTA
ncbi:DNA-processing protein DprA [Ramlibacter sp.]|uniref:DNA-processing protein DprA n=1 Tax=Ramlibacter sp. TaxID=1917967 RepID=UPI003D0B2AC7